MHKSMQTWYTGARQGCLSISVSRVCREWSEKKKNIQWAAVLWAKTCCEWERSEKKDQNIYVATQKCCLKGWKNAHSLWYVSERRCSRTFSFQTHDVDVWDWGGHHSGAFPKRRLAPRRLGGDAVRGLQPAVVLNNWGRMSALGTRGRAPPPGGGGRSALSTIRPARFPLLQQTRIVNDLFFMHYCLRCTARLSAFPLCFWAFVFPTISLQQTRLIIQEATA